MGGGFSGGWVRCPTDGAGLFLRDADALRTRLSHHGLFLKQRQVRLPEGVAEMFEQLLDSGEEAQDGQVGTGTLRWVNQGHWRLLSTTVAVPWRGVAFRARTGSLWLISPGASGTDVQCFIP